PLPTCRLPSLFLHAALPVSLVQRVFDDDLDPGDGDPDYQFGAGPIIDLTDGVTNLHALQTMSVPDVHVYKPDLQVNAGNVSSGRSEDHTSELQSLTNLACPL